ncbi:pyridoxamine 5'-phosphate oxidase family protein [Herbidospora mongoliensis]|uniref:pyridoxamine 5'-phosphate oxidase family protein n=1 Tax=Herbidospora mongoliensis TaxID=688067 RepID=UPI000829F1F6|nr:pyridoxamine 5'-phosphate oxidase family protein [Herbidospora mongoliensis]
MRIDSAGLSVLSREECLRLLATTPIGRLVFTHRALPAVEPVNYVLDGETVVVRTTIGSRLAAATRDAVVAFEIDDIDKTTGTGWSVTVLGHARGVTGIGEIARLAALPLLPWTPSAFDHFVTLSAEEVSGRRIM